MGDESRGGNSESQMRIKFLSFCSWLNLSLNLNIVQSNFYDSMPPYTCPSISIQDEKNCLAGG